MKNTTKIVVALAAGVATGALLGVLFAPAKGEETRNKISEQKKKISEKLKRKCCAEEEESGMAELG